MSTTQLIEDARAWIAPYWNADHLVRTLDWLLELEPEASDALRLAAITHDVERMVPGGPEFDPATMRPGEDAYRIEHSERSAAIVGEWLTEHQAEPALIDQVRELVELHEVGGSPAADLLQAADSLSFLEVNAELVAGWAESGRCSKDRAREQHDWMFERITPAHARALATPLYEAALARLEQV